MKIALKITFVFTYERRSKCSERLYRLIFYSFQFYQCSSHEKDIQKSQIFDLCTLLAVVPPRSTNDSQTHGLWSNACTIELDLAQENLEKLIDWKDSSTKWCLYTKAELYKNINLYLQYSTCIVGSELKNAEAPFYLFQLLLNKFIYFALE